jgi:hypothetical protein
MNASETPELGAWATVGVVAAGEETTAAMPAVVTASRTITSRVVRAY